MAAPAALAGEAAGDTEAAAPDLEEAVAAEVPEEALGAVDADTEVVVVTGSRLKRDTYSSVAPLLIITAEVSREAGLVDAGEILQQSSAAGGAQIDLTFSGFVLDNGPGAVVLDLRGLGEARTLSLINGRRMAPGGVEGAPVAVDLNLVPGLLIGQYDLLLDGASSIYGSDAVAGVANIILRKDFDGLELDIHTEVPDHSGGRSSTGVVVWGRNFDRGFIGGGIQYGQSDPVTLADRPWTAGCARHVEVDEGGRIRQQEQFYPTVYGMEWDDCALGSLVGRVSVPGAGSIYYTPGRTNGGWPNFSESSDFGAFGVDGDGDGRTDVSFRDYDLNGREQFAHLYGDRSTWSGMAYGEYTLDGDMNLTPYFEVLHSVDEFFFNGGASQLFPQVPANNPFNLCNPEALNGTDCGLARDALFTNPNYIASFANNFAGFCASRGVPFEACTPATFGLLTGAIGPVASQPIVAVRGDRNTSTRRLDQTRVVVGASGDLPWINFGSLTGWTFDASATYSISSGTSGRPGIREDRLELALGDYSTTNTPCENDTGEELAADAAPGCVPINLFASTLYPLIGDFATEAERSYVFDSRDFKTEYEQTVVTLFASGDVFDMPAGPVSAGLGVEWRLDDIVSLPDDVARDGLLWGFFSDGGAVGDRVTQEFFVETELPLLGNLRFADDLTLNLSARLTDDEYYGSAWTGSAKVGYRPVSSLLIRSTYGTSYRAPNLRELFLRAQTGFLNLFDPCLIPEDAINDLTGEYQEGLDDREQIVLDNCRATGIDPTLASNNGFNVYSVEVAAGGSLTLDEETSTSWTAGFSWEQPFTTAFDLSVGMTYYETEVEDTIIEPPAQFLINDCYNSETGNSVFCSRIQRQSAPDDPNSPLIELVDRGFINRDAETARGVDFVATFETTVTLFDLPFDVGIQLTGHRPIERSTLFVGDDGEPDFNTFQREWYFSKRIGSINYRLGYDQWRLRWTTRFVGGMDQDPAFVDDLEEAIDGASDTCLGPPDDVLCRDVGFAGNYSVHSASLSRRFNFGYLRAGVSNVFDEWPPQVDGSEGPTSINNTPLGAGYDLSGRTFFVDVGYTVGR